MTLAPALLLLLLEAREAEVRHVLPPALLVAVVLHESGGRQRLVSRERGGACSVGPAQVLVPGCCREFPGEWPCTKDGCTAEREALIPTYTQGIAHPPRGLSYTTEGSLSSENVGGA